MLKYFDQNAIFSPSSFLKYSPIFPKTVILSWQASFMIALKKTFTTIEHTAKLSVGGTSVCTEIFEYNNHKLGFALLPAGAPIVSMVMEEMHALGAERFVFIGSCGLLTEDKNDSLIVPTHALRDEGTSWHYLASQEEIIAFPTADYTANFLKKFDVPYRCGTTWTTDAFYRETAAGVKYAKQKGCICVEMECAAIAAVSQAKNLPAYQILFSADKLTSDSWNIGRLKNMQLDAYGTYLDIVIKLADSLENLPICDNNT